jgi:hypothetical protein
MNKKRCLTAQELALYLGCDVIVFNAPSPVILKAVSSDNKALVNHEHHEYWMGIDIPNNIKPILRPISDMTDEEILQVCEIANHLPFVNKKKWEIKREKDNIFIRSEFSDYSFMIYINDRTGFGDVNVYRAHDPDDEIELEQTGDIALITKFYLERRLDCFGWIEQGLAINKTKILVK